jgi:hypothetical protein
LIITGPDGIITKAEIVRGTARTRRAIATSAITPAKKRFFTTSGMGAVF